jgi:hypothetical protein
MKNYIVFMNHSWDYRKKSKRLKITADDLTAALIKAHEKLPHWEISMFWQVYN